MAELSRCLTAKALGTAMLVGTVVGSGIMADRLSDDVAVSLLGNTIPTGAILFVLITILGPISGAHFNPVVAIARSLTDTFTGIRPVDLTGFILAQIAGALVATALAAWLFAESRNEIPPIIPEGTERP
ncbi:MAG: aquaporin [Rhizobium rhizophilum]|uniref:aquaporin n=1 Tax=Rhizobium rhizophilum TaxID=1850373 RepID=UPI00391C8752